MHLQRPVTHVSTGRQTSRRSENYLRSKIVEKNERNRPSVRVVRAEIMTDFSYNMSCNECCEFLGTDDGQKLIKAPKPKTNADIQIKTKICIKQTRLFVYTTYLINYYMYVRQISIVFLL